MSSERTKIIVICSKYEKCYDSCLYIIICYMAYELNSNDDNNIIAHYNVIIFFDSCLAKNTKRHL